MSTISSDDLVMKAKAEVLWALKRWAHVQTADELVVTIFDSPAMQDILQLSLRESHPIEDGEGWVLVPRDWIEAKGPDPETGEEDPRVIAALRAWRPVMGLADGEYLPIHEHILVPFGRTMQAAMAAAINAAMLAAPRRPLKPRHVEGGKQPLDVRV